MSALPKNTLIDKRYRIIKSIAEGGFGYTYLAEDMRKPSRPKCVVKQFKPGIRNSQMLDDARRLFRTEAQILEKLGKNEQIPELLAYCDINDEEFYIIQELIQGKTLTSELILGEPWSEQKISQMLREVLSILSFVHQNNVIHRDVKPDNLIRRDEDQKLVLVDFGAVKQFRDYESHISNTIVVGTPGYMPTEQSRGKPRCNSDIYSLGIIAIQAATGLNINQLEEDTKTGEIIWQPWARNISSGLTCIITKMVQHQFSNRYQSTQEVLQALEQDLTSSQKVSPNLDPEPIKLPTIPSEFTGNVLTRKLPIALLITLLITLLGVIVWLFDDPENTQTVEQPQNISATITNPKVFISSGEIALLPQEEIGSQNTEFQTAKNQGTEAMVAGNYSAAADYFQTALQQYPNAPETRIYLNNALSQINNQKNYTIAVVVPISKDLEAAQAMLRGVAQAQDKINQAGGINGTPLRVVIANDGNSEQTAQKVASLLGENEKILGVVGNLYSDQTLAAGNTYENNKLVAITLGTSTKIRWFSPYVFRISPSDDLTGKKLANYMLNKWENNKAAIFYDPNSAYSKSLRDEFFDAVDSLGGEVVLDADWSVDDFNANREVSTAIEMGAQVLMLVQDNVEQLDKALQVARASHGKNLKLIAGDVMYSSRTLRFGAEDILGMVVGTFWHMDADPNSEFSRQSHELWGAKVNWITAMAYDGAKVLIEALSRTANPSRNNLKGILSSSDFSTSGASHQVRFHSRGDRMGAKIQLVKVVEDRESNYGYKFEPILE